MNFRHLKYFIATAELGQISKAASQMNITQSAITSAIKELELELDVTLFHRSSKGMEMTREGRDFLQSSYEIMDSVERAKNISDRATQQSGKLKLAVTYTVAGYFLPKHLRRISELFPNIQLGIMETTREAIEEGLIKHDYDLAIVLTSNTKNPELITETLLRSPRRLWLPIGHPLSTQTSINFVEISKEPYIMLTVDEAAHTTMRYWGKTKYRPNVRLRTSSIEAVRSMVANGEGVTILSDMVYRPWSLEGRRIITAPTSPEAPTMNIGLAWPRYGETNSASKSIIDYFRRSFQTGLIPF